MFHAQVDGPVSTVSSLPALPASSAEASPHSPLCDLSHRLLDPTSALPQGMSPVPTPDEGNHRQFFGAGGMIGESGNSVRSRSPFMATPGCSDNGLPPASPKVTFEDFAIRFRQNQQKQARRKSLERRLHATKVSVGISSRLTRIGAAAQRGLVDCLKHDDKINFVSLYHTLCDIQESCDSALRRQLHRQDPCDDLSPSPDSEPGPPDFFHQLSPQSRADLLEILQLVRSDPQFLVERLCSLTPAQLANLTASASVLDAADSVFSALRSHSQPAFSKRNPSAFIPHKDHAFAFERTDPLSALLFNVFAAPLDSDTPEARLRLDVWSSVCARLITHDASRFYPLVGHILSSWAMYSNWKAKPKFELYLMDILQSGAFLLEHIDTPPGLSFDHGALDPLRTDVAEEFFASSVIALFNLLDDPEAGFPQAVIELGCAILGKLGDPGKRDRFLEFFFVRWFFAKFLSGALAYPETHGLLLDFHIRKDAREKLLGQVGLRAHSQFFAVLRSMPQFSAVSPTVRQNIENIISRFNDTAAQGLASVGDTSVSTYGNGQSSAFLMLSSSDILTILKAVIPRNPSMYSSPTSSSVPVLSVSPMLSHPERSALFADPGFLRPENGNYSRATFNSKTPFPTEMNFLSLAANSLNRNADRIRFELSELGESGHPSLEHPSMDDWAIFSIAQDGRSLVWGLFSDDQFSFSDNASADGQSTTLGIEDNNEALQTAIIKLVQENSAVDSLNCRLSPQQTASMSLTQRFDRAMSHCHHDSDVIGAHYWWNASQQLLRSVNGSSARLADDSWILEPMHSSSTKSLNLSRSIIERCESDFVMLDRTMQQLQRAVKDVMATIAKLRNKMWYMTDVKNSMRYEDAKNVALALKKMIYSALYDQTTPNEGRSRGGPRSLGGSLIQKPELQVMNVMKAPSSQGGPNKLSDEQVELTRKWLSHNNIDNFCRGEERIHRFCYEVKTSINRLVGETMTDAPVLWSSELFQTERSKYEGHGRLLGVSVSSSRPFSAAGEDSVSYRSSLRASDAISRLSQDIPPLARQSSFQSLMSDNWTSPREYSAADTSSIGNSPGRAASTSTRDSCSTFWSTPHQQAYYAASASSLYSRPPSMFSDTAPQPPRRNDRKTHGKQIFLDELKQALTSLLLSDLGSPVWSCGSETDAWFANALDQRRIRRQMEKRARMQRFYEEYDDRSSREGIRRVPGSGRSRSLEPPNTRERIPEENPSAAASERTHHLDGGSSFSYGTAFRRLIEVFSRHGNPFIKLKALRDLRALVIASLNSHESRSVSNAFAEPTGESARNAGARGRRQRASFSGTRPAHISEKDPLQTPSSPVAESIVFDSQRSDYYRPTDNQIVDALKRLLLEIKPKTLFRDLQFISAFASGEALIKTDSGKAFLQFGLAALGLKDEVCNSMVEIADLIVSQELSRRHPPAGYDTNLRRGNAIEDAAGMWIITAKEGNPVAQRELAILYLTHPELLPRVTLPLTSPRDTFKAEMMYRRDKDSKSDPQSMCLALHWMQLSANGGDGLARNRLRERQEFDSIA